MRWSIVILLGLGASARAAPCPPATVTAAPVPPRQEDRVFCAARGHCETVPFPPANAYEGSISSDGTLIVLPSGHVFDVRTRRLVRTLKAWKGEEPDAGVQLARFIGNRTIETTVFNTPVSAGGRLFDLRSGRLLGPIGSDDPERGRDLDDMEPVPWRGDQWMFVAFTGDRLFIQDVRTGKLAQTIELPSANYGGAARVTATRSTEGTTMVLVPDPATNAPTLTVAIPSGAVTACP